MNNDYFRYTGSNQVGKLIAKPTADALLTFCEQEPEFEQAIEQSGKSFDDCIKEIAGGLNASNPVCSDFTVFGKAVQFYFPGATISYNMDIHLSGTVEAKEKKPYKKPKVISAPKPSASASASKKLTLNLDDLLDF